MSLEKLVSRYDAIIFAQYRFRVNMILPRLVETPFTWSFFENIELYDGIIKWITEKRAAWPEELGAPTIFLVSDNVF